MFVYTDDARAKYHEQSARLTLVGAGPGDPELITIKAIKAIKSADVILYDSLVNPRIFNLAFEDIDPYLRTKWIDSIDLAPEDIDPNQINAWLDEDSSDKYSQFIYKKAKLNPSRSNYQTDKIPELIFVGKRKGRESIAQEDINKMILEQLRLGKHVLRLKGGDPFIFARGVEEIEIAKIHGYDYSVIPGLTSGLAVPVAKGITLTLRGSSDSVTLVTGHQITDDKIENWARILDSGATVVVYMGLSNVVKIIDGLKTNTEASLTAIAIHNGTLEDEKVVVSSLDRLAQDMINEGIKSPAILIFGQHVSNSFQSESTKLFLTGANPN